MDEKQDTELKPSNKKKLKEFGEKDTKSDEVEVDGEVSGKQSAQENDRAEETPTEAKEDDRYFRGLQMGRGCQLRTPGFYSPIQLTTIFLFQCGDIEYLSVHGSSWSLL